MALRKLFIQSREFVPEVAEIVGMNVIDIEYEFGKAEILGEICVFEVEISPKQVKELNRRAKARQVKREV